MPETYPANVLPIAENPIPTAEAVGAAAHEPAGPTYAEVQDRINTHGSWSLKEWQQEQSDASASEPAAAEQLPLAGLRETNAELAGLDSRATMAHALEQLRSQHESEHMWRESAILTTNRQVTDRQIRMVDQSATDNPQVKLFMKLDNWVALYQEAGRAVHDDVAYAFDNKTGTGEYSTKTQARLAIAGGERVALIHDQEGLTLDGLVEVTVPLQGELTPDALAQRVDRVLEHLTGEKLWDAETADDSMLGWKLDAYRRYKKLGEGPLSPKQAEEASQLVTTQVAPGHFALVAPGQSERYVSDMQPGERIVPFHEVQYLDDAVQALADGALVSSLDRMERGSKRAGRSSRADVYTGGGDVVYTYAGTAETSHRERGSRMVRLVMGPEILDRIDVRAYEDDAYASTENELVASQIDQALERVKRPGSGKVEMADYNSRLRPEEFGTLGGVHELCFEGAIGAQGMAAMVVGGDKMHSFEDTRWEAVLQPYATPGNPFMGSEIGRIKQRIEDAWTSPEAAGSALAAIGLPERQIAFLTAGMNLAPYERAIAKLKALGVHEVNGRRVEAFVVAPQPWHK